MKDLDNKFKKDETVLFIFQDGFRFYGYFSRFNHCNVK